MGAELVFCQVPGRREKLSVVGFHALLCHGKGETERDDPPFLKRETLAM
jgi:hypothetical protein